MTLTVALLSLLLRISLVSPFSHASEVFNVRHHVSTATRYDASIGASDSASSLSAIPDGCEPIHLNLVARHGTREPTQKRIEVFRQLPARFQTLIEEKEGCNSYRIPEWMRGWESPWKDLEKGGQLVTMGEEEHYRLALRLRERFKGIFGEEYHPDIYPMKSTQIPRSSASAAAFCSGLFSGKGTLGRGKNRACSVISENRERDNTLRFFESCDKYKEYKKSEKPAVEKLKEPILDEITSALIIRIGLNFERQDIATLWILCKQEASLLNIDHQACSLFNQNEIELLEWTDDLELFKLKGYGKSINYRMAVPLLKDIFQSMEQAIITKEENKPDQMFERANLRFAHAETIVPLSCLLGLFLEESEFEKIQRGEELSILPKPPMKRNWKGSVISPFAGNNMIVLYQCGAKGGKHNLYHVQVLHNEVPVRLPACGNSYFCPSEDFKEYVVEPHLKHDFNITCGIKEAVQDPIELSNELVQQPAGLSDDLLQYLIELSNDLLQDLIELSNDLVQDLIELSNDLVKDSVELSNGLGQRLHRLKELLEIFNALLDTVDMLYIMYRALRNRLYYV